MEIIESLVPEQTIEQFADDHDLIMEIHERRATERTQTHLSRYYCHFRRGEIKDGSKLIGATGNGNTKAEAITNYANRISERKLVINSTRTGRKELDVPRLITGI